MREKNPPQQNHSKQKQEKQAKNSPKPQQQQQQQQNQPKQKLISKTQFVLGSPLKSTPETNVNSNVAATVTNPVQILARPQQQQQPQSQPQQIIQQSPKQSQPPQQQQQQQQPSTPNSTKLGQTAAVATAQSQNLLGESLYFLLVLIKLFDNNVSAFNYLLIKLFEKITIRHFLITKS